MLEIFVSHSSRDVATAKLLADLFRSAFLLPAQSIRCTSVDGYRLAAGANTDQELRREVLEAKVLIGLISSSSFESAYVLFEEVARRPPLPNRTGRTGQVYRSSISDRPCQGRETARV